MQIFQPARRKNIISLTPLIDVVFILLIFFMLATSFSRYGSYAIRATESADSVLEDSEKPVHIVLDKTGVISIDSRVYSLSELQQRLQVIGQDNISTAVTIKPATEVPIQEVVYILDILAELEMTNVTITR